MTRPNNSKEEPTINPIIAVCLFIAMMILLGFFGYVIYKVMTTSAGALPLLAIGLLGDPFRTSRKITIEPNPDHKPTQARSSRYRKGHRERAFERFVQFIFFLVGIIICASVCAQIF